MLINPIQRDYAPYDRFGQDVPILNRDSPLSRGLYGWWVSRNNTFMDYSGHGLHMAPGAAANAVGYNIYGEQSTFPFSVNNTYTVAVPAFPMFPSTMAAWVLPEVQDQEECAFFAGKSGSVLRAGALGRTSTRWRMYYVNRGVTSANFPFQFTIPYLMVGIFASVSDVRLYVNGALVASSTVTVSDQDVTMLAIGSLADSTPDSPWQGGVLETMFWKRALSSAEVFSLWNPATRWDLYWRPKVMVPGFISALNEFVAISASAATADASNAAKSALASIAASSMPLSSVSALANAAALFTSDTLTGAAASGLAQTAASLSASTVTAIIIPGQAAAEVTISEQATVADVIAAAAGAFTDVGNEAMVLALLEAAAQAEGLLSTNAATSTIFSGVSSGEGPVAEILKSIKLILKPGGWFK